MLSLRNLSVASLMAALATASAIPTNTTLYSRQNLELNAEIHLTKCTSFIGLDDIFTVALFRQPGPDGRMPDAMAFARPGDRSDDSLQSQDWGRDFWGLERVVPLGDRQFYLQTTLAPPEVINNYYAGYALHGGEDGFNCFATPDESLYFNDYTLQQECRTQMICRKTEAALISVTANQESVSLFQRSKSLREILERIRERIPEVGQQCITDAVDLGADCTVSFDCYNADGFGSSFDRMVEAFIGIGDIPELQVLDEWDAPSGGCPFGQPCPNTPTWTLQYPSAINLLMSNKEVPLSGNAPSVRGRISATFECVDPLESLCEVLNTVNGLAAMLPKIAPVAETVGTALEMGCA